MLLRALRRKFRAREVIAARWVEMPPFYERKIAGTDRTMLVCEKCEKRNDNDPACASSFKVVYHGPSEWHVCEQCGETQRRKERSKQ